MEPGSERTYDEALDSLAAALRERLLLEAGSAGGDRDLHERIRLLVEREAGLLDDDARARLATRIAERSFGLGPLESLLGDPTVDEVMVNGPGHVWVERHGRIEPTGVCFDSESDLRHAIERILAPLGRRVDESVPLCDARLPDRKPCAPQWIDRCRPIARRARSSPLPTTSPQRAARRGSDRAQDWRDKMTDGIESEYFRRFCRAVGVVSPP